MAIERWIHMLGLRWRSLVRRDGVERDLDDELQDHIERQIDIYVSRGIGRPEARRLALNGLGGMVQVKERCRDSRGLAFLDTLRQDVRYGARVLRREPTFAIVVILTLGLGIGVNTAVFSLVDGILLARLPFPEPERLVSITGTYPQGAFAAMRQETRTFIPATYAEGHWFVLKGDDEPVRVSGARVSAELFSVLGSPPALGRWLRPGEDAAGRDAVVILGHAVWQQLFRADPRIIGRQVQVDGVPREVVAVMPPSFRFPSPRTQIWVPLGLDPRSPARYWAGDFMPIVGRLRPDATIAQAGAEAHAFQSRVLASFPWRMPDDWNRGVAAVSLQDHVVGPARPRLLVLLAAVALIMVTACANVANLSLSRTLSREREIALRLAVGAGPRRIARQLLTESVMLAALAGTVGLLLAAQALSLLKRVLPVDTPRLADAHLNWRVLLYAGALAVGTGLVFGIAPVARSLRVRLRTALEAGGRGASHGIAGRWRAALAIAQLSCAVLLVSAAGLLVRSLWTLSHADPGFRADRVIAATVTPAPSRCEQPARCVALYRTIEASVQSMPEASGVSLVNTLPLTGAVAKRSLELEDYAAPAGAAPLFWLHVTTPDYFRVIGISLEEGRAFALADADGPAVAIITRSTARRFWPGASPLGKHVRFVGEDHWRQIIGVAADVRGYDLTRSVPEWIDGVLYVPYGPRATLEDGRLPTEMTLVVRTTLDDVQAGAALKAATAAVGDDVVIGDVRSMGAVVSQAVAVPAAMTTLLVVMAGLALLLGSLGVYGVLSFVVATQTHEFGIRLALGATPWDLAWLVMKHGGALCLAGTAIGLAGAAMLMRGVASELHGVTPTDPMTYAAVACVMALVTAIACYVPTRRVMRVDPLMVLRQN